MKTDLLDSAQYMTCILGVSLANMETILSLTLLVLSIILALINIVLKVIKALKDKKIDDNELKDIINDVEKLKEEIDNKRSN